MRVRSQDRQARVERLKGELKLADEAILECDRMPDEEILRLGRAEAPTQVFTSTLPVARQTGDRLFSKLHF